MMSHEIRIPLSGILSISEVILSEHTDIKLSEQVGMIRSGGENLLLILIQYISESITLFQSVAQRKDVTLTSYFESKVPRFVKCDAKWLKDLGRLRDSA